MQPMVIKLGGHELNDHTFLTDFAAAVAQRREPLVLVHGGGRDLSDWQERLGITPRFIDGIRVTDEVSLALAEMVLCGLVNKRIVRYLLAAGVRAIGISALDAGMVSAQPMTADIDMGFTGAIVGVDAQPLRDLLTAGFTPVVAPVCYSPATHYNVNADHVAGALAGALGAERLTFLTNVAGVLANGRVLPQLTIAQAHAYIAQGVIYGGMVPKVQTALEALAVGVRQTAITNLEGLQTHGGTVFRQEAT